MGTPPPFRPPGMAYPPPQRPGLGVPHPGNPGQGGYGPPGGNRGFVREVKTTKVFVGSISPGVTDATLEELLNVSLVIEREGGADDRHVDHYMNSRESLGHLGNHKLSDSLLLKVQKWS
jgi:hypothetical protein